MIKPTECILNFSDLQLLEQIAREQMMFPSWRNANPERTRRLEDVLYRLQAVDAERSERCLQLAKNLRDLTLGETK